MKLLFDFTAPCLCKVLVGQQNAGFYLVGRRARDCRLHDNDEEQRQLLIEAAASYRRHGHNSTFNPAPESVSLWDQIGV